MTDKKAKILYVDDEENNLISFRASFRNSYQISTAISVAQAEELLLKETFQVILADQRMPFITGVQFFEQIRDKYPDPLRILITGYTDINAAIDAINKGEVFRFLNKPWDPDLVERVINQAIEIYRTRTELRQRNIELEKAYEELDKFVYSASHDLRAPLMSVLGITNLALMETDVQSQNEYLELIRQSVKKLDIFIINIIDYYKNARGQAQISEIDFNQLINEVCVSIQFLPEYGNIKIQSSVTPGVSYKSDLIKLRIIFNNLITNAVKFQDRSKSTSYLNIVVEIDKEALKIRFEDNGIGIKEDDLDRIFKMFYRADVVNSGSGIGLYIVNEAVKKLEGNITVTSQVGEGSIFEITIPSI
ncbi:hybrid sensor histidine kinase/response regulator [Dyadobacter sp. 32]|uniref:ATP-binding response regulator n=1 Tax=Dyadobacter sp. 32 TaxID=538966 RepID=UPI0011EDCD47